MAAISSFYFTLGLGQGLERRAPAPVSGVARFWSVSLGEVRSRSLRSISPVVVRCSADEAEPPSLYETLQSFRKEYRRAIPDVYSDVIEDLLSKHHFARYRETYQRDPIFSLGFVTVYDQLMEGFPSDKDRDAIFRAYIKALKEDPIQYRLDAQKMEEWARTQNADSLLNFKSSEGVFECILKDISQRAYNIAFSYNEFFSVGLNRILELANANEPAVLAKLCAALNIRRIRVLNHLFEYDNLRSTLSKIKSKNR